MHIKNSHLLALSVKILPAFMLSLSIFAVCSCKKAPSTGEAFVTLKSDEIRFLGDLEVSFYESDFPKQLESFQASIIDSAKVIVLAPFEDKAANLKARIAETKKATASFEPVKIKEAFATLDSGVEEHHKNQDETAHKSFLDTCLKTLSSRLARDEADLKKADNTIAAIKNSNSISQLNALVDTGHKGVDVDKLIITIKKFLSNKKLSSTRTGSDGKFKVPSDARFVMAYHFRESTKNELFWLIKINLDEDQVKLTNSNMTNARKREGSESGMLLLEVLKVSFDDQ
jgi:hypothetical protein